MAENKSKTYNKKKNINNTVTVSVPVNASDTTVEITDSKIVEIPAPVIQDEKEAFFHNHCSFSENQRTFDIYMIYTSGTRKKIFENMSIEEARTKTYEINKSLGLNYANRVYNL